MGSNPDLQVNRQKMVQKVLETPDVIQCALWSLTESDLELQRLWLLAGWKCFPADGGMMHKLPKDEQVCYWMNGGDIKSQSKQYSINNVVMIMVRKRMTMSQRIPSRIAIMQKNSGKKGT